MSVIKHLPFDTELICLFLNLVTKPGMYNYVGVHGLQRPYDSQILLLLFSK